MLRSSTRQSYILESREDTPREEEKVHNLKRFPEISSLSQSLSTFCNTV